MSLFTISTHLIRESSMEPFNVRFFCGEKKPIPFKKREDSIFNQVACRDPLLDKTH